MSERSDVQQPLIRYATEIGWEHVPPADALRLRGGPAGLTFSGLLAAQLQALNPGIVDEAGAAEIIRQIHLLRPGIEGNRDALDWLRGERSIFLPDERRERNVRLIDFEHLDHNRFQVTDEWQQKSGAFRNRADVVFLINGVPVAIAETKSASRQDAMASGIEQLRRYHRETPEMVLLPQVFEVTQLWDFLYGVTWNVSRKNLFNWKDEQPGDFERKVKAFFDRARFVKVLRDYVVFLTRDDQLDKLILRQHQTRAVEKVIERIHTPGRRRGLIWHTQGSGKTLTMITIASRLLREAQDAEKPTVLMLVDRNELEQQLFKNIAGYGITTVEVAQSKRDLRRLLSQDFRGLLVSIVHKFDGIPANVNPRDSVIVLVDEAHRTTGGDLGNYLMGALPNATYIGFTGTPIDRLARGQGTFKVFGGDDPQGYLDKYSIAESIVDGTTVRLNYALAPSELRVNRDALDSGFLSLSAAEGLSEIEELNAVLDRAIELKSLMKAPDRVRRIAAYVAHHFKANVQPLGFKAFLVGVDREACALYKAALDQFLPPEASRVVYSPAHNDPAHLKPYYLDEESEKKVRQDFARKGRDPQILIVTEKLLTGFDAPILYCMYLDKPMRDHVLLQAIARVNRPYEDDDGLKKPYGFVLDFVGIFERLETALAFDSDVVGSVIQNLDVLKELFARWMAERAPAFLDVAGGFTDKDKERAVVHFDDRARREEFLKFFRELQALYDILSPDVFLRPMLDDYLALAELFALLMAAFSDRERADREITTKTRDLLNEHTQSGDLALPGAIYNLGPKELAALKQSDAPDAVKLLNLRRVLMAAVAERGASQPYLLSLGERAEALIALYEDRQLTTQQALLRFEQLTQEAGEADEEAKRLGLDANAYAVHTALKPFAISDTSAPAGELSGLFARFPDYEWNDAEKGWLRTELYKALRPLVAPDGLIAATNALLGLRRV